LNITDQISESLETIFVLKILKFFDADPESFLTQDPGWKKFGSVIREKHPGSATLVLADCEAVGIYQLKIATCRYL
jgi:hypothetical protein